jgi:hypothetical protein
VRYESGLREGTVRRDDITEMTSAMHRVLAEFDPMSQQTAAADPGEGEEAAGREVAEGAGSGVEPIATPAPLAAPDSSEIEGNDSTSLTDVLPPDPLLNETLHRIMFALEMVVWDRLPTQVTEAPEIRNLELEPREIETYRRLAQGKVERGTAQWDLDSFFLSSAALRVKMEDERREIARLEKLENPERLYEILERSAQSLERARDIDRRFQWFIDDMLFRGDTKQLEDIYRSRFRFLHAYSGLWLAHQRAGGLTPL